MREDLHTIEQGLKNYVNAGTIIFLSLACFFILLVAMSVTRRRRLLAKQKEMQFQYQHSLLQTQLEIQEQTLKTISQEIHDNIGQVLSLAKLNLNTLDFNDKQKLLDTKQLVSKAINDLRDLSRSMHGDKIAELGLQEVISNELIIIQNTGQFLTSMQVTGHYEKLEPQNEMVLFRITQEALNNAIKHSGARNLSVQLDYHPGKFILVIKDDGIGFNISEITTSQSGLGLTSLNNRSKLIGATLHINSSIGSGTIIIVEMPLKNTPVAM